MFENDDGRIVLLCPLANRVLIGSTDIPWDDPDRAICTAAEEQYFLRFAQKAFPDIAIRPEHIVFRSSGVGPLPTARAATTGQINRDHSIQTIAPGQGLEFPVHCMVGGKWTPCRAFGQEVTDLVLAQLGRQRQGQLETLPIGGGRDYPATQAAQQAWLESLQAEVGLPMERVLALFERYGTGACQVAAHIAAGPDEPLHYHAQYSRREIAFMAQRERVVHLDDLLLRRASIAFLGELTPPLLEELAGVVGETLGWPAAHRQAEIDRTARLMVQRHGVL
jgi:glycerol-3-phosphate dehydrogenase